MKESLEDCYCVFEEIKNSLKDTWFPKPPHGGYGPV